MAARNDKKRQPKKTNTPPKKEPTVKPKDDFGGSTQVRTQVDPTDRVQRQEE